MTEGGPRCESVGVGLGRGSAVSRLRGREKVVCVCAGLVRGSDSIVCVCVCAGLVRGCDSIVCVCFCVCV